MACSGSEPGRWSSWSGDSILAEVREPFVEALEAAGRLDFPHALDRLYAVLEAVPEYPPALLHAGASHYRLRRYGDAAYCRCRQIDVVDSHAGSHDCLQSGLPGKQLGGELRSAANHNSIGFFQRLANFLRRKPAPHVEFNLGIVLQEAKAGVG